MERLDNQSNYYFPKRPSRSKDGSQIRLATNFFKFSFINTTTKTFFKYAVDIQPEIPGDSVRLRRRIWSKAKEEITKFLGHTIFNNTTVYSFQNITEILSFKVSLEENSQYEIKIKWANVVDDNSLETLSLFKKFFGQMVGRLKLTPIRRNFFDSNQSKTIENFEVWPGFNSSVNLFPNGILLNINMVHKVFRQETALEVLSNMKNKCKNANDFMSDVQEAFKGCVVLTRHNNNKTYIIDSVDFTMNPTHTFEFKGGKITFIDYYKTKYARVICDTNQPLLIHKDKKKDSVIFLIPELCYLTGLTEEIRSNFNVMKKLATITKGQASEKIRDCIGLINAFMNNEECKKDIQNWGITISDSPVNIVGRKLFAGNILMHKNNSGRFSFSIDGSDNIDRQIQNEMYSQPQITKWVIMSTIKDKNLVETMNSTLSQVLTSFKYTVSPPNILYLKTTNFGEWEEAIRKNVNTDVQALLLILPGPKGKGYNYNELKRLLSTEFPIPSQVILGNTLSKPKGLRSVLNKVLMQICAKVGGEPWAIDKMPCTLIPTMVIGIDVYNKFGKIIIGCCASFNNTFTKYISVVELEDQDKAVYPKVVECVMKVKEKFAVVNKIQVQHIIILRDGISPSQVKLGAQKEIEEIRRSIELNIKITYVLLNKKNNLKVFSINNNDYSNIPPGTLVDDVVVDSELFDFYLVSQKTNQGLSQATHYNIVYDDFQIAVEEIQLLVYKLCYLYYNWTGGIKIPAPCQYAKKLAFYVGDILSKKGSFTLPADRFANNIRSLYFL